MNPRSRLDRRFAALKLDGRAGLHRLRHRRRSRLRHRQEDPARAAGGRRRRDRARHAVLRPDGGRPAVQASSLRALQAPGRPCRRRWTWCAPFARTITDTPIVLMGYYNPIYIYPRERFLDDAKAAGVDGLIIVDVPPEADEELCLPAIERGLNFIRLATPTTDASGCRPCWRNTSASFTTCRLPASRARPRPTWPRFTRSCPNQEIDRLARGGGLRRENPGAGQAPLRRAPTASWSARPWLMPSGIASARRAKRLERQVQTS